MNKLEVVIIGNTNSGKSALSVLIHDALLDHNIDCEVIDQDGDISHINDWDERIKTLNHNNTQVTITQKQKLRSSMDRLGGEDH